MLRILIIFMFMLFTLLPFEAEAARDRVAVRFSIGGVLIIGGGFLVWNIGYSSRISQNESESPELAGKISTDTGTEEQSATVFLDAFPSDEIESVRPLDVELPLLVYRW